MIVRLSLAVILFSLSPSLLLAQTAVTNPEVQALREEVMELKARLAGLESKLEALAVAPGPAPSRVVSAVPIAPVIQQAVANPTPPVERVESQPISLVVQKAPKPAPFAFGAQQWY